MPVVAKGDALGVPVNVPFIPNYIPAKECSIITEPDVLLDGLPEPGFCALSGSGEWSDSSCDEL